MSARILILAALVFVSLGQAAPAPFLARRGPAAGSGLVGLQGEWALDSLPALAPSGKFTRWGTLRIQGNTFTFCGNPAGTPTSYTARLLPGDMFDLSGGLGASSYLGRYRLKGDVLTLRYGALGQPRPASIEGPALGYTEHYRRVRR
jgi:hypothetical protein